MVLPFAFFGLDSYRHSGGAQPPASVNGVKISAQEFDSSLRQQQEQLRQRLGPNFDPALFDTPEMKKAVLDNLIAQRLLLDQAMSAGLVVTDEMVAQVIGGIAAFQEGGKFNKKRYETILESNGLSPLTYAASVRSDLLRQQMQDTYAQNGFASYALAKNLIRLNEQQRVVSLTTVALEPLMGKVKVDATDIKKYYEEHQQEFAVPEQAKVEYVELATDELKKSVAVTNEELAAYYDAHKAEFGTPEQRQVSHILINASAKASQAELDAAKVRAQDVLDQVRKAPARFADLARQYSQDPGSATRGGDLGYFGRGMMVKPFEDAAFAMKQGEVSDLVRSDFGYHIIKVVAIKPARVPSLEEIKEPILNKIRQQKASERFAELAEQFSNIVYEQSDTLKPAADLAGAKIQQSGWLVKGMPAGELWNAKALQAVFSDDSIRNKRNTAAIEISPSALLAARVIEFKPASVKALAEVEGVVKQRLLREQAGSLALKQGKEALLALQSGGAVPLTWAAPKAISRGQHAGLDIDLARAVFQVDTNKLPQYVGAELPAGGYAIARVEAVKEAVAPDEGKQLRYLQQLRQLAGEELFQAYIADAKSHADIKVHLPDAKSVKSE